MNNNEGKSIFRATQSGNFVYAPVFNVDALFLMSRN
jgi:hypothetical protein